MSGREPFRHSVAVRYGECDQQGVVFNANYLAYVDDTMVCWMRSLGDLGWVESWDVMLKRAEVVWHSAARWPDVLDVVPSVTRWGTTSFDVTFELRVGERSVATIVITYVSVRQGETSPSPTPAVVRAALGG